MKLEEFMEGVARAGSTAMPPLLLLPPLYAVDSGRDGVDVDGCCDCDCDCDCSDADDDDDMNCELAEAKE